MEEKTCTIYGIEFPHFEKSEYGEYVKSMPITMERLGDILRATRAAEHITICGLDPRTPDGKNCFKELNAAQQYLVKFRTAMDEILKEYYPDEFMKVRLETDKTLRSTIEIGGDAWRDCGGGNYQNIYGDVYGPDEDGLMVRKALGF